MLVINMRVFLNILNVSYEGMNFKKYVMLACCQ